MITAASTVPLRIAVIGAGPAGLYVAEALMDQDAVPVTVDLIDRLPTPFGLVRHGIAPDHLRMRALRETLRTVLDRDAVRFIGNVEVGVDISLAELRRHVDAVVYTYGAAGDRRMGIDGEELAGVLPATALVRWYTGHPDAEREMVEQALSRARDVVVVGVGNVALDVARVLSRGPGELEHTDMPQHVLDALAAAPVERVTVLGRRGPAQATFTPQELRELSSLQQATLLVDPAQLNVQVAPTDRLATRNLTTLRGWAGNVAEAGRVALRLRFFSRPIWLHGDDRVTGLEVQRTETGPDGEIVPTPDTEILPADLVIRSVGYRGHALPGIPVDPAAGTVLHTQGRVLRNGTAAPGEYAAGWIKRGPSGVVGTNKADAHETVASMLADVAAGVLPATGSAGDWLELLALRGVDVVLLSHWDQIDAAERALGAVRGRDRTTLHDRAGLLAAARTLD